MTVLEVIHRSAEYLERKGVESPRLQAELLLAHVLHRPRLHLYLEFERPVAEPELGRMRELVRRRGAREPLQYLVGSANFCGLELAVSPAVLIPRPETEGLAERAWTYLQAQAATRSDLTALDFGTGTGCLAIALAVHCPAVRLWAVELAESALELARANAARHGVAGRIEFLAGDGFAVLPPAMRFDVVVANPPYIPSGDLDHLQPEVRDHEPRLALDGGPDGLRVIRRLATEARAWLRPQGRLFLEVGDGQAEAARALFAEAGWSEVTVDNDWTNRPRMLIAGPGVA